ncbi:DUF4136 domain-containing protein [Dyadobacter sp. 32]|uniref:DUF4136 domain-containing protein n=1 Tax=Dyadobacter sp. 32 TaxID=538966 RepID=UPI0039C63113
MCLSATLFSCSKDPLSGLSDSDSQIFVTNHDNQANFKLYKTFSVVDSVQVVEDNYSGTGLTSLDRAMLIRIIDNMEKLGYKYVLASAKPDVGINLARITNTSLNVVSQPISPYWGYGGGYGYGYPNYYTYYQTSESYWSMSMIDLKNPDTVNNKIKVIWNAQIRGSGLGNDSFVSQMVDSVFGQSSYLKNN